MPRISHAEVTLQSALNDLQRDWETARADWRDRAKEQFAEEYIEELQSGGRAAVRAMTEVTLLLRKVVRQCS